MRLATFVLQFSLHLQLRAVERSLVTSTFIHEAFSVVGLAAHTVSRRTGQKCQLGHSPKHQPIHRAVLCWPEPLVALVASEACLVVHLQTRHSQSGRAGMTHMFPGRHPFRNIHSLLASSAVVDCSRVNGTECRFLCKRFSPLQQHILVCWLDSCGVAC